MRARKGNFRHTLAAFEDNIAVQATRIICGGCVLLGHEGVKAAGIVVHIRRFD